eukprot:scaffold10096_cov231-Isochrysis_galbana.AAC.6
MSSKVPKVPIGLADSTLATRSGSTFFPMKESTRPPKKPTCSTCAAPTRRSPGWCTSPLNCSFGNSRRSACAYSSAAFL